MAFQHRTYTVPAGAPTQSLKVALPDGQSIHEGGQHDTMLAAVTFQLLSGTKVFIGGSADVSSTDHAIGLATTNEPVVVPGPVRLSDFFVTGTAGDVLTIGTVDL